GQQALLEEKQAEQQRLEREIQSRAQVEFHRLQSEAEALRSELATRDAKLADALKARGQNDEARVEDEKEIQVRAQAEFQRLQSEAEALRAELAGRDTKLVEALHER